MVDEARLSVQDRDLLGRLNQYFDTVQLRLKEGQGWLIFNSHRQRAARIAQFIAERIAEYRPLLSYYFLPWRDFALDAYITNVELAAIKGSGAPGNAHVQREYRIADRVSQDMRYHMLYCDLFVLAGIAPANPHEALHLDSIVGQRHSRRLASILITPRGPDELAHDLRSLDPSGALWERFFRRMYETSLIAL
mgnify:CR=1 FL=1